MAMPGYGLASSGTEKENTKLTADCKTSATARSQFIRILLINEIAFQ
jgi:hypothetical protein